VRSASWLPRLADFEGHTRLFDNPLAAPSPEAGASPMYVEEMGGMATTVLRDRKNGNGTNVSQTAASTPVVLRKSPTDGTRKSARRPKPRLETGMTPTATADSPVATLAPYKPRRSKYDV
jgi:hypothetical protein